MEIASFLIDFPQMLNKMKAHSFCKLSTREENKMLISEIYSSYETQYKDIWIQTLRQNRESMEVRVEEAEIKKATN